ncbi:MAG: hypothetical protein ACLPVO_12165 [Desulfomonilaceae bacterium]
MSYVKHNSVRPVMINLVLDNQEVPGHNETTLMEALFSRGCRQGAERFQYYRTVNTDIGPLDVRVDLLTPETEEDSPGETYPTIRGVNTISLKGGDLAFANTVERAIEGRLLDGEKVFVSVHVKLVFGFKYRDRNVDIKISS